MADRSPVRHSDEVPLQPVSPDDTASVAALVAIHNAAQRVDDPEGLGWLAAVAAEELRYGWDLQPEEHFLYVPEGADLPVAALAVDLPKRDNLHLFWLQLMVHPDHRRRGHGTAVMTEALRMAEEAGRHTLWVEAVEDDLGARKFAERFGFAYASHDARRRQRLADVDQDVIARLFAEAEAAAADYTLERLLPPVPDAVLTQMVEVTAAINDAPMGTLTFEDEVFDLRRLQDIETARARKGNRSYRMVARHRETGEIGGHTQVVVSPRRPHLGLQADTAVARAHRGHRLGLLLKIAMMRWLAEAEPQLELVETWNNADNRFMISVNELLGYRLSNTFATYELTLPAESSPGRAGHSPLSL
jgi:GNAT superfamily N-acetyltransferase